MTLNDTKVTLNDTKATQIDTIYKHHSSHTAYSIPISIPNISDFVLVCLDDIRHQTPIGRQQHLWERLWPLREKAAVLPEQLLSRGVQFGEGVGEDELFEAGGVVVGGGGDRGATWAEGEKVRKEKKKKRKRRKRKEKEG